MQDAALPVLPNDAQVQGDAIAAPDAQQACTIPADCPDVKAQFFSLKACCTAKYACGYELPMLDELTASQFPDTKDFFAMHTQGDPNGRCAPSTLFFGAREGLYDHRVEPDEGPDILITPTCMSYTLGAFILPGCCLPNNTCALSTDESAPTLQVLANGAEAPFTKPECVPAATLNQQLREAGLASFARTEASGTCNYATLSAALPPSTP